MTTPTRNLGGVSLAAIQARQIQWRYFVRVEFLSGPGTVRFCDKAGGFTGSIDGGSQTWTEASFRVGPITQGRADPMAVSWIEFDNLDYTWTNWASSPGIRDVVFKIYVGWFDVSTGALLGAYLMFAGKADDQSLALTARITLKPFATVWTIRVPWALVGINCPNPYRDPFSCQYLGAEPAGELTCDKTFAACQRRSNTVHFNGANLLPPPGTQVPWGPFKVPVGAVPPAGGGSPTLPGVTPPGSRPPIVPVGGGRPPTTTVGER